MPGNLKRFLGCCVLLSQVSAAESAARNLGHPTVAVGYSLSEIALRPANRLAGRILAFSAALLESFGGNGG